MDAISQTTFSNAFSRMKMYEFRFKISLKFVPRVRMNNIPTLVQIMTWRRSGDKPLSESMMVSLPTHICVTWPQWVNYDAHGFVSFTLIWLRHKFWTRCITGIYDIHPQIASKVSNICMRISATISAKRPSYPVPDVSIYYMSNINELPDGILFHWFCKCTPPWMFLPLDIPSEYRPEHVTFGLLCVIFKFPSRIFCRRVPGFATDCPCGVWCRGLTTCLLYVGPPLEF